MISHRRFGTTFLLVIFILENGTDGLYRNVGKEWPLYTESYSRRGRILPVPCSEVSFCKERLGLLILYFLAID